MSEEKKLGVDASKRSFLKKLAYVPPVVMTLNAVPSYATYGSGRDHHYRHGCNQGVGEPVVNDGCQPGHSGFVLNNDDQPGGGIAGFPGAQSQHSHHSH